MCQMSMASLAQTAERATFNRVVVGSIPAGGEPVFDPDYLHYRPPPRADNDDPFFGEYGTNTHIPGIAQWVQDMRIPYWIAEMRNCNKKRM